MVLGLRRHGGVVMSSANLSYRHGHGRGQWWALRLSALALIPLLVWFVASLVTLTGASHGAATVLLLAAMFYHAQLGLQEVLEDYVAEGPLRRVAIMVCGLAAFGLATAAIAAVLSIALGV